MDSMVTKKPMYMDLRVTTVHLNFFLDLIIIHLIRGVPFF